MNSILHKIQEWARTFWEKVYTPSYKRIFVAFDIDTILMEQLRSVEEGIKERLILAERENVQNMLRPERRLHVTLVFIGKINSFKIFLVKRALKQVAKLFAKNNQAVLELTYKNKAELYETAIVVPIILTGALSHLHKLLLGKLKSYGIHLNHQLEFKPHTTIANIQSREMIPEVMPTLENTHLPTLAGKVNHFTLYQSINGQYIKLATYHFTR